MMDVNTLIAGALLAGLKEASKATAGQAVKDGYQALKQLVKDKIEKFSEKGATNHLDDPVERFEKAPEANREYLIGQLSHAGIEADTSIRQAADSLLRLLEQKTQSGDINQTINVSGSVGSVQNFGSVNGDIHIGLKPSKDA